MYILLIAYIVAINFYAFILEKTLRDQDAEREVRRQGEPLTNANNEQNVPQKYLGKLLITGALGGAITMNSDKCTLCRDCVEACPINIIKI